MQATIARKTPKAVAKTVTTAHPTSFGEPPAPGTRALFRLGDLVSTPLNVRTEPRTPEDILAMAQSIHAHGSVLQNLVVVAMLDADDRWTGKLGAVAGETRRLGLCLLRDGGIPEAAAFFTDEILVPCTVVAHPEARAASLTENAIRSQLSAADQFEAFKALVDDGADIEQVAAMYGVTPAVVERRLRLANAAPALLKLHRDGGIELKQLMALYISEDHELQLRVWKSARSSWERRPDLLRGLMTRGQVSLVTDPIGVFVGAQAYEAAGGVVTRDLFSEQAEGFASDPLLLHQLAQDKLDARAEELRTEGWAWVEARTKFDHAQRAGYVQCTIVKKRVADASKPYAGAVVCIDRRGEVEVIRGLIRPDDRKAHAKALKQTQKTRDAEQNGTAAKKDAGPAAIAGGGSQEAAEGNSGEISRPLSLQLGAQRTAALQLLLARKTSLALACLAHTLVRDVFMVGLVRGYDPLQIDARGVRGDSLTLRDTSLQNSRAYAEMQLLLDGWRERVPDDDEGLFAWLTALPVEQLLDLLGVCVAATATTVQAPVFQAEPMYGYGLKVAQAAGLDIAQWWEPTGDAYLASVSKAHVIAVVREVRGAEACSDLDKLAKAELVAKAETLLQGSGWVPDLLRLNAERPASTEE